MGKLGIEQLQAIRRAFVSAAISKVGGVPEMVEGLRGLGFDVGPSAVYKWKGKNIPPGDVLLGIAIVARLSLDEVLQQPTPTTATRLAELEGELRKLGLRAGWLENGLILLADELGASNPLERAMRPSEEAAE